MSQCWICVSNSQTGSFTAPEGSKPDTVQYCNLEEGAWDVVPIGQAYEPASLLRADPTDRYHKTRWPAVP